MHKNYTINGKFDIDQFDIENARWAFRFRTNNAYTFYDKNAYNKMREEMELRGRVSRIDMVEADTAIYEYEARNDRFAKV